MHDGRTRLPISSRPWEAIAEELAAETKPARIIELAKELNSALDNQALRNKWKDRIGDANISAAGDGVRSDYQKIVDDAVRYMHSDYASLQMLFPERGSGGELRLLAFRGFNPEAAKFWEWVRADSRSTCGIALAEKKRVIAPDIVNCDFMARSEDQEVYVQTGILACQTTPLIGLNGNVVGMISTHWRTAHQCSEGDLQLFDTLARQAADLIECRLEKGDLPPSEQR